MSKQQHEWSREALCKLHQGDPAKGVDPMTDAAIGLLYGKPEAIISFARKRASFWDTEQQDAEATEAVKKTRKPRTTTAPEPEPEEVKAEEAE